MEEIGGPLRSKDLAHTNVMRPPKLYGALPLLAGYWSFGQFWGVWVIMVLEFQMFHRQMSESRLGLLYTLLSIVGVLVMMAVAPRLRSLPLRTSIPLALGTMGLGCVAMIVLPTAAVWLGFMILGVGNGLIDVFMNVAAQKSQTATNQPVLQWMHASYAAGGVTGAAVTGLILFANIDFRWSLAYAAAACWLAAAWNARTASSERAPKEEGTNFALSALFKNPILLVPALVVMFSFLVEGLMDVWSGLYMRREMETSALIASMAFVGFSTAIVLGRLFAGKVLYRLGNRRTVIACGVGSLLAGLLVISTGLPWLVGLGYLLLGFAISGGAPAGFGLLSELKTDVDPTTAVAAVTTIGYTGFVVSPALLGYLAQTVSLRAAMAVIVVATLGIIGSGMAAPSANGAKGAGPTT